MNQMKLVALLATICVTLSAIVVDSSTMSSLNNQDSFSFRFSLSDIDNQNVEESTSTSVLIPSSLSFSTGDDTDTDDDYVPDEDNSYYYSTTVAFEIPSESDESEGQPPSTMEPVPIT